MLARARDVNAHEPPAGELREVVRLLERIQAAVVELEDLRRGEKDVAELHAKERALEQLRARPAATARRSAHDEAEAA
jgi:hypothetical protein